jgi:hypothetical protein
MQIKVINGHKIYINPDEATMDRFDEIAQGCVGFLSANHRRPAESQQPRPAELPPTPEPASDS